MLLQEFFKKDPEAYQDLSQDNSQPQLGDLRKTRLTLRQLNNGIYRHFDSLNSRVFGCYVNNSTLYL